LRHPEVAEAVVIAREDEPGEKRLVAYIVGSAETASAGRSAELIAGLREYLKRRLPAYMLPSAFMQLNRLPLTSTGKVDRRSLPAPQGRPEELRQYVAPRTDLERALAEIWTHVLRVERVGVHDDFFELGGHSLLATRVITRISHALDVEVPIRMIFERPTVEALAAGVLQDIAAELSTEPS
jgi:hypothetical protein